MIIIIAIYSYVSAKYIEDDNPHLRAMFDKTTTTAAGGRTDHDKNINAIDNNDNK